MQSCSLGGPQWGNFPKIRLAVVILIFYPKNEMRWFCFFQGIEIAPNTVLKISRYWNHPKYCIKTIKSQVVFWIHPKYSNHQIEWGDQNMGGAGTVEFMPNIKTTQSQCIKIFRIQQNTVLKLPTPIFFFKFTPDFKTISWPKSLRISGPRDC